MKLSIFLFFFEKLIRQRIIPMKMEISRPGFLFVCRFTSNSRILHLYAHVNVTDEGLPILTYTRHFRLLSNEDSLTWCIYFDIVHLFIMVIYKDPLHSHSFQILGNGAFTTCVYDLGLSWLGCESRSLAGEADALPMRHRGGSFWYILNKVNAMLKRCGFWF